MAAVTEKLYPVYTIHAGELLFIKQMTDINIKKRVDAGNFDRLFYWLCGISNDLYTLAEKLIASGQDVCYVNESERTYIVFAATFVRDYDPDMYV